MIEAQQEEGEWNFMNSDSNSQRAVNSIMQTIAGKSNNNTEHNKFTTRTQSVRNQSTTKKREPTPKKIINNKKKKSKTKEEKTMKLCKNCITYFSFAMCEVKWVAYRKLKKR